MLEGAVLVAPQLATADASGVLAWGLDRPAHSGGAPPPPQNHQRRHLVLPSACTTVADVARLDTQEHPQHGVYVQGLKEIAVSSHAEIQSLMEQARHAHGMGTACARDD